MEKETLKKVFNEKLYADYDEEMGWSVYGLDSGFCYATPSCDSLQDAEEWIKEHYGEDRLG